MRVMRGKKTQDSADSALTFPYDEEWEGDVMEDKDIKSFEDLTRAHTERLVKAINTDRALSTLIEIYLSSKEYREKFQEIVRQHTVRELNRPLGVPIEDE